MVTAASSDCSGLLCLVQGDRAPEAFSRSGLSWFPAPPSPAAGGPAGTVLGSGGAGRGLDDPERAWTQGLPTPVCGDRVSCRFEDGCRAHGRWSAGGGVCHRSSRAPTPPSPKRGVRLRRHCPGRQARARHPLKLKLIHFKIKSKRGGWHVGSVSRLRPFRHVPALTGSLPAVISCNAPAARGVGDGGRAAHTAAFPPPSSLCRPRPQRPGGSPRLTGECQASGAPVCHSGPWHAGSLHLAPLPRCPWTLSSPLWRGHCHPRFTEMEAEARGAQGL